MAAWSRPMMETVWATLAAHNIGPRQQTKGKQRTVPVVREGKDKSPHLDLQPAWEAAALRGFQFEEWGRNSCAPDAHLCALLVTGPRLLWQTLDNRFPDNPFVKKLFQARVAMEGGGEQLAQGFMQTWDDAYPGRQLAHHGSYHVINTVMSTHGRAAGVPGGPDPAGSHICPGEALKLVGYKRAWRNLCEQHEPDFEQDACVICEVAGNDMGLPIGCKVTIAEWLFKQFYVRHEETQKCNEPGCQQEVCVATEYKVTDDSQLLVVEVPQMDVDLECETRYEVTLGSLVQPLLVRTTSGKIKTYALSAVVYRKGGHFNGIYRVSGQGSWMVYDGLHSDRMQSVQLEGVKGLQKGAELLGTSTRSLNTLYYACVGFISEAQASMIAEEADTLTQRLVAMRQAAEHMDAPPGRREGVLVLGEDGEIHPGPAPAPAPGAPDGGEQQHSGRNKRQSEEQSEEQSDDHGGRNKRQRDEQRDGGEQNVGGNKRQRPGDGERQGDGGNTKQRRRSADEDPAEQRGPGDGPGGGPGGGPGSDPGDGPGGGPGGDLEEQRDPEHDAMGVVADVATALHDASNWHAMLVSMASPTGPCRVTKASGQSAYAAARRHLLSAGLRALMALGAQQQESLPLPLPLPLPVPLPAPGELQFDPRMLKLALDDMSIAQRHLSELRAHVSEHTDLLATYIKDTHSYVSVLMNGLLSSAVEADDDILGSLRERIPFLVPQAKAAVQSYLDSGEVAAPLMKGFHQAVFNVCLVKSSDVV